MKMQEKNDLKKDHHQNCFLNNIKTLEQNVFVRSGLCPVHFYLNSLQIWYQQKFWFETHIDLFRKTNLTFRKDFLYFLDEKIHSPQYRGWNITENMKYFALTAKF
jgi:hypothetical protein